MLVTFHEDAQSDLKDAVFYYEARMVGLGLNLFLDVEDTVALIVNNPEAYPLIGKTVRRIVLRRYPYSIIYAVIDAFVVYFPLVLSLPLSCLSRCLSRTKGEDFKAEKGAFFEEKVNEVGVFLVSETQARFTPRPRTRQAQ